jgi:transcriptional regulator with XRE-family HTH domain
MAPPELARTIRDAMTRRELSYRDVADQAGLGVGYVNRLARGQVGEPSPNSLRRLAPVIGVEYMTLLGRAGYL